MPPLRQTRKALLFRSYHRHPFHLRITYTGLYNASFRCCIRLFVWGWRNNQQTQHQINCRNPCISFLHNWGVGGSKTSCVTILCMAIDTWIYAYSLVAWIFAVSPAVFSRTYQTSFLQCLGFVIHVFHFVIIRQTAAVANLKTTCIPIPRRSFAVSPALGSWETSFQQFAVLTCSFVFAFRKRVWPGLPKIRFSFPTSGMLKH